MQKHQAPVHMSTTETHPSLCVVRRSMREGTDPSRHCHSTVRLDLIRHLEQHVADLHVFQDSGVVYDLVLTIS